MMDENTRGGAEQQTGDVFEINKSSEQRDLFHSLLLEDGVRWRAQYAPAVEAGGHRLRARLRATLDEVANGSQVVQPGVFASEIATMQEEQPLDQQAESDRHHRAEQSIGAMEAEVRASLPPQRQRPRGRRVAVAAAVAAALLFAVFGTVIVMWQQRATEGLRPPTIYTWSPEAVYGSKTPQEAFAAGMNLTPCRSTPAKGAPPRAVAITWLDTGTNYGLALIRATCMLREQPYVVWSLFALARNAEQHWDLQNGAVVDMLNATAAAGSPIQATSSPATGEQPPLWLALPPDRYSNIWIPGPKGPSIMGWCSPSRIFVLGHVADPATQPAHAMPVVVNGHTGWVAEQNDVAIVTLPLADGTTVFFAGTAPVSQVEDLAARAFAHMDEVLAPLSR